MKVSKGLLMHMYSAALQLYPKAFRTRYGAEMQDTVLRLHAESTNDLPLIAKLGSDALASVVREHLRASAAPSPGYMLSFGAFFSCLLLTVSVAHQQVLRRGADREPQRFVNLVSVGQPIRMDEDFNEEISSPAWLHAAVPFLAIYDASGKAVFSDARLHGFPPQPPAGVFRVIAERGEHKVTWQPERGIRIALVGKVLPNGQFVLAGQSLLAAESSTSRFDHFLLWMWATMVAVALALVARGMVLRPSAEV